MAYHGIYRWDSTDNHWQRMSGTGPFTFYPGTTYTDPAIVAGSAPVGTAVYPVPAGALFVDSVAGNNANPGTIGSPFRTVEYAFSQVPVGGNITIRGGTYHEGRTYVAGGPNNYAGIPLTTANVTVQNYPGEAVWFDGSSIVTGWTVDGSTWRHDGWTIAFDRSPTYSFGAADDPRPGWSFINPSYPTAAWPERVFIDGVALTQVSTKAAVTTGTFYIDQTNDQVFIGSNPTGKEVRITDLQTTVTALAAGVTFRGFGVRRYAPSQPHLGAVKILRTNNVMENLWFEDISCVAVAAQGAPGGVGANQVMRNCTILRSGSVGLSVTSADNFQMIRVRSSGANIDHFNYAPATGGVKITRLRTLLVKECDLSNNFCKGLWTDESVSNVTIVTNNFVNNEQRGVTFELTGKITFANNLIALAGYNGVDFLNCDEVHAWNNTVASFGSSSDRYGATRTDARGINVIQDNRAPMTSTSVGLDPRQPFPHPDGMDWVTTAVESKNNIVSKIGAVLVAGSTGQALVGVEDYNKNSGTARSYSAFGVDYDGNVYNRVNTSSPTRLSMLAQAGSANVAVQFTLSSLQSLGFDIHSTLIESGDALNPDYSLQSAYAATAHANARPIPDAIASLIGIPAGTTHAGCWR